MTEESSTNLKHNGSKPDAEEENFYDVHESAIDSLYTLYGEDHNPSKSLPEETNSSAFQLPVRALSFATISWVVPLIWKGFRKPIRADEVPQRNLDRSSSKLLKRAEEIWKEQVRSHGKKATLWSVMFRLQAFDLILGTLFSIVQGTLFAVARPLLLRALITSISDPTTTIGDNLTIAVGFSLAVFFEGFLQAIVKQLLVTRFGSSFVCWVTSIVQHKATRVSPVAAAASSLQESTLVGHDVIRMYEEFKWFSVFPFSLTALIGGSGVLIWTLGIASVAGFVVMLSIIAASMLISKRIKAVEEKDLKVGDIRVSIMKEIISGIKAIKMMAWEVPFQELLGAARDEESIYIKLFRVLQVSSINMGRSSPVLSASVSIFVVAFTRGGTLDAAEIFAAITAFQSLRLPLISVPTNLSQLANFLNYVNRFDEYMKLDDLKPTDKVTSDDDCSLRVVDATFQWIPESKSELNCFRVQNATFSIPRHGGLVAVVGSVASGKTSLISSCLGSMTKTNGSLRVVHNVGFVPQKAFTLSGTLLDNVLMGQHYDDGKVTSVLKQSALDEDMKLFPRGLKTEIGERGVTLSGGQQQRLAIARALYQQPELLVLDDPLAAVDPGVADTIFRKSVLETVRNTDGSRRNNRSVLMALNQLHFLPEFDSVIVMDQGRIAEQGTYEELIKNPEGTLATMLEGLDVFTSVSDEVLDNIASRQLSPEQVSVSTPDPFEEFSDAAVVALREASSASDISAIQHAEAALDHRLTAVYMENEQDLADANKTSEKSNEKAGVDDLLAEDKGEKGAVAQSVLQDYFSAVGKSHVPGVLLLAFIAYGLMAANDLWLASWVQRASGGDASGSIQISHIESAGVYVGMSIGHVLFVQAVSMVNAQATVRAGKRIHKDCVNHLLHAPITWFEGTPSGRVISRFSGDLSMVDRQLAMIFDDCIQFGSLMTALCIVICYVIPELVVVIVFGVIIFVLQLVSVDRTNREVKRYANQALAPVLTNISETVNARTMIQVMKLERYFCSRHWVTIDEYSKQAYCSTSMVHWGTLISSLLSFLLSTVAALIVVLQRDSYEPALVGLALTYSFLIPYFLMILSMVLPLGFVALTSVERVLEYKSNKVPQEPEWFVNKVDAALDHDAPMSEEEHVKQLKAETTTGLKPAAVSGSSNAVVVNIDSNAGTSKREYWPPIGCIEFDNVSLVYRPGLPPALKSVSVTFQGGSKTGIIGRTGAGKSSLTQVLFRVNEPSEGRVIIDGQDISQMGLQLLRGALTIIPQSPLLMGTTVKANLDPFGIHTNDELIQVLEKVGLKASLLDENTEQSKATSLSSGERQMVSIARVLLKPNLKVVVMDEPTANIDFRTDEFLQKVVRTAFSESTLLTIAHRLSTVVDFDNILVMDKGMVSQFGPATELMKDTTGIFHQMVTGMGEAAASNLMSKAK